MWVFVLPGRFLSPCALTPLLLTTNRCDLPGEPGMTEVLKPARRSSAALEKHYRFLLWLVPTVEKFPRA
ncbi:MAG: hypothetical protein AW07_03447 [Candidatus Accumulibacter sp. SK-11]|nr:MAG: hypothetical protein AW07_03447 [Candidatus Accumulibacter sp. SK-11]